MVLAVLKLGLLAGLIQITDCGADLNANKPAN